MLRLMRVLAKQFKVCDQKCKFMLGPASHHPLIYIKRDVGRSNGNLRVPTATKPLFADCAG